MKKVDNDFNLILTQNEIEAAWGASVKMVPTVSFNLKDVPEALQALIPYAFFWGVSDDWAREDLLKKTPEAIKKNLKLAVSRFDNELDNWLAGDEASNPYPTDAYIAFSAMRMAADFI